jgi:hypothetical protein
MPQPYQYTVPQVNALGSYRAGQQARQEDQDVEDRNQLKRLYGQAIQAPDTETRNQVVGQMGSLDPALTETMRRNFQQQDAQALQAKLNVLDKGAVLMRDAKTQDDIERIKPLLGQLGADPKFLEQLTIDRVPQILAMSPTLAAQIKATLQSKLTEAQTNQANAHTNLYNTQAAAGGFKPSAFGSPSERPLPSGIQAKEDEDIGAIQNVTSINSQLQNFLDMIKPDARGNRQLDLGPVNNFMGGVRNTIGASSPNSVNLATFRSTMEQMRNQILMLHKGVQTEGDATRAMNALLANINDPAVVTAQLTRIKELNQLAARQKLQLINVRRQRNARDQFNPADIGYEPTGDTTQAAPPPPPPADTLRPPPQAAIDFLKSNPQAAADFDAKYGRGAAKKFMGR